MVELPPFAAEASRRKAFKSLKPQRKRVGFLARIIKRAKRRK